MTRCDILCVHRFIFPLTITVYFSKSKCSFPNQLKKREYITNTVKRFYNTASVCASVKITHGKTI